MATMRSCDIARMHIVSTSVNTKRVVSSDPRPDSGATQKCDHFRAFPAPAEGDKFDMLLLEAREIWKMG